MGLYCEISGFNATSFGFYLPINLFPFVMPRAPDARHSEQGTFVQDRKSRQLF